MDESPAPDRRNRILRRAGLFLLCIAAFSAVIFVLKPPEAEPRALFLHPDGQLSLGSRDGAKFPPSAISAWPFSECLPIYEHFILDATPETPASKWFETIEQLASLGYASYQLRSAGEAMNFHIPVMMRITYSTRTESQWIDIRPAGGENPRLPEVFDVVVIEDDSTTCGQVLAATRPHRIPGRSLLVTGATGSLGFRRTQNEDEEHKPPKRTVVQTIRGILPF